MKRWSDEEVETLDEALNNAWAWQFPGWQWVAGYVNRAHGNKRSAGACRRKAKAMNL